MNFDEFKSEIEMSFINIDNIGNILDEFHEYQNIALDTLREFHRLCENNGVSYQLAYGSLLGAIRDNGQIPWDYDIDVFVPYEQKTKLLEVLKTQLGNKYYYTGPETDPHCCRGIIRIAPKGYNSDYLHVDVFYLTGIPIDEQEALKFRNMLTKIQQYRYFRFINPYKESHGVFRSFVSVLFRKIINYRINWRYYSELYEKMCTQYPATKSNFLVDTGSWANHCKYKNEDIMETQIIETRDGSFRVPIGYDTILTTLYSDYKKYMSIEVRVAEMLNNYWKLKKYGRQ